MSDRRTRPRPRALKGGRILFNNGNSTLDCRVTDLSPTSARLEFASTPSMLPDQFELLLTGDQRIQRCRLIWRSLDAVGVFFDKPEAI
jgi:hypothetical protein